MSGKRRAGVQVTRENLDHFEEDNDEEPAAPSKASAEVLSKRKILKPKSRLGKSTENTGFLFGASAPKSSGFSFSKPAVTSEEKPPNSNPFSFLNNSSTVAEKSPQQGVFSLVNAQNNSTELTKASTELVSKKDSDKPNKIKALNENFYGKLTEQRKIDPFANFTPILEKYIDYYDRIENDLDFLPDADEETKVQKALPAPSGPVFSFGKPKAVEAANSDNNKPELSFGSNNSTTVPASTFNFSTVNQNTKAEQSESREFTPMDESRTEEKEDVVVADDSDDSDDDIKVEGPKFTLEKPPTTSDSVFKLSKEAIPSTKTESKGPSFVFSGAANGKFDSPFKLSKPKDEQAKNDTPKEENKAVTNKAPAVTSSGFSFSPGSNNFTWSPDKPVTFTESKSSGAVDKAKSPAFSFTNSSKPAFSFGKTEKPVFTFGSNSATQENKPADSKPIFSTNADNNSGTKPIFNFGSKPEENSNSAPVFNFGGNATSGFSIGKPPSSSFQFSFTSSKADESKQETGDQSINDAQPAEQEVEGNFKPVIQLTEKVDVARGEEEEEVKYTKRSKIMLFNPSNKEKPYEPVGLGELKVLQHRDTKKSRVLVRSDGANRVLLNATISKDLKYDAIGKGDSVRIPVVTGEGKIETYIARVKTPEDGSNLLNALQDAQESG